MTQRLNDAAAHATKSPSPTQAIGSQIDNRSTLIVRQPADWVSVLTCLSLALAVWVAFGQTRHHDFFNLDDKRFILDNSTVTQGLSLKGVIAAFSHINVDNWAPLTTFSYMVGYDLYGLDAGGHHLTNVVLHAATAVLLFLMLHSLTGLYWPSAFVAAVFAIHPLRVESVAWVTERKDVLSGLFFVLTLGAYARYVRRSRKGGPAANDANGNFNFRWLASGDYWLVLGLFTLGLLSKPMLVTLPFVLLLLDYWPLQRLELPSSKAGLRTWQRLVWEKSPFLLLSAAAGVATILTQQTGIESLHKLGLFSRMGNALVSYAVYLWQMWYPADLAVLYPHPGNQLSVWKVGVSGVVLGLITLGVVRWQHRRPYLLVGWLWYLGMLVPVIGLLQVGEQAHADRFTYLPQIGLYVMIAWGIADWCGGWRWRRVVVSAAAGLILVSLLVVAHGQTRYWRDSVSLWRHTLDCTAENFFAYDNLGISLSNQGKLQEAIPYLKRAIQLKPDSVLANTHLGQVFGQQGKWQEAIPHFETAVQLKPDSAIAQYNLGYALGQLQKWAKAVPHFERALQLEPNYAGAQNALGVVLGQQGRWTEAIAHFERALQLNPNFTEARNNLAFALSQRGK